MIGGCMATSCRDLGFERESGKDRCEESSPWNFPESWQRHSEVPTAAEDPDDRESKSLWQDDEDRVMEQGDRRCICPEVGRADKAVLNTPSGYAKRICPEISRNSDPLRLS
jgi:hypothetical protein